MPTVTPTTREQIAELLLEANCARRTIEIAGAGSKREWGGPRQPCEVTLQTTGLRRLLAHETNDLTVSVEAGMPFAELQATLARHGQMLALDPPYMSQATVGGLLASNSSGALQRHFGTLRDLVIGMTFATPEGKIVSTGGNVVKNVAGLDIGKLLIGSFGTLAVIVSANFRVHPIPEERRTFLYSDPNLASLLEQERRVLHSPLRPIAVDLLNPAASSQFGFSGYTLAIRAAGSKRTICRYTRDLGAYDQIGDAHEARFWTQVQELNSQFLQQNRGGVLARIKADSPSLSVLMNLINGPAIWRSSSGWLNVCGKDTASIVKLLDEAKTRKLRGTIDAVANDPSVAGFEKFWSQCDLPDRAGGFETMKKVKALFDPNLVLNPSRLYGRI